ncbi:sodium/mannose cotransporter SLC5A10-like [Mytilus edulis]|uniref:sodium/mannose cotransporter SLC5A10-like n=1 Tax=Mytilus edulis TaxID=6550 RepID=UPI0039EEA20B
MKTLNWADILIILLYLIAVLAVGIWTLFRPNRGNIKSYFLAGRSMPWFAVGASLFGSNIGSEHFLGLAGAGAASGIALVLFEWLVTFQIVALGWIFVPVYISAGVFTVPQFIQKRHGGKRLNTYLSCMSLVMYILTKLSVSIFAGSVFIELSLGWNTYVSIIALLVITGFYTILGGLTAVMFTDTLQSLIMNIGAFIVTGIGFYKVGGYNAMTEKYMMAIPSERNDNSTCGLPRSDAFHLFLDADGAIFPWPGLVMQATIGCIWYWCFDQVMVQRTIAAKNISHAKGGVLMTCFLKVLPLFTMVFPGMISRILFTDEVGCADTEVCKKVCDNEVGCSNIAYAKLVMEILPNGLRGFMIAVMLSAIMSSLTSIFNSASTIFTIDVWQKIRKSAGEKELLIVGRLFVTLMCGISILFLPLVKAAEGGMIFAYINAVDSILAYPIGMMFLLSIFWKGATEQGCFYGLLLANCVGLARLILMFVYPEPACGEPDTRPALLSKVHFLYFGVIINSITIILIISISFITKSNRRTDKELHGCTWWTRIRPNQYDDKRSDQTVTTVFSTQMDIVNSDMSDGENKSADNALRPKEVSEEIRLPVLRRITNFLFGNMSSSKSSEFGMTQRKEFLTEINFTKNILNVLVVLLFCIIALLIGIYR